MLEPSGSRKVIVTGATSMIGHFLLDKLLAEGYKVHAISRASGPSSYTGDHPLIWHQADISQHRALAGIDAGILIHLAPLWLLPPLLHSLDLVRVIGFGTTSVFSKASSANAGERQLATRLAEAEAAIGRFCIEKKMAWTLFRPTLVYDGVRDRNVTLIARFIKRYGFFPLLGQASGLRQPVHADDLALACIQALDEPATVNKAYNLSGGETLSYREMVEKIFRSLGKTVRFLPVPAPLFSSAMRAIALLPGKRNITPEMASRMNKDLCFDHSDAIRDFGFSPRGFLPRWGNLQG
ncbi:MAG TPA: NAD-dependent epimerase/dehydratase family protein [Nitrosospira sp.]|nr:NAD-dependent epimerase/dehydratase family protein [Nitrosospira sp.]